jgi:nucleotide-binding universal stress UspA family protein
MAFKDILVALTSYPEPSSLSAVEDTVSIAALLDANLAALSCETHVQVPGHFLAGSFANISGIISGEGAKSRQNAHDLLAAFEKAADKAGVRRETIFQKCTSTDYANLLVDYARLRDLTIMPVPEAYNQTYAEAVIFGSGKPTLVLPETPRSRPFELGTVVVAWDSSRAAARAISDALPLLEKAKKVRVVTITDEKKIDTKHSGEEVAKNLARHGINIVPDKVETKGKPIGNVLESYTSSHEADLLVMGAYGHSRLRQFILGGATKSLLSKPPLPILFAH